MLTLLSRDQSSFGEFEAELSTRINKTERESGLKISWVRNYCDLKESERRGLFSMYCNVFAEEPYREKFDSQDVKEYFRGIVDVGGLVFTASIFRKGAPDLIAAFVASQPLASKEAVLNVVSPYIDIESSSYFAEDAVIPERRRQGVSRSMKRLLIDSNRMAGFQSLLLRTSVNSFQQLAAVTQLGAKKIDGLYQDVDSLRLGGEVTPDRRAFFVFDLSCEVK